MATHAPSHVPVSRQTRGAETRTAILEAAEQIFAEAGLAGARTDAIAVAAGVNKALLYYYFSSKDALYRAVLEDHLEQFRHRVRAVLDGDQPAPAKLLAYVGVSFDFISSRPYYPSLMQRLVMTSQQELARFARLHFQPVYRRLVKVIEAGVASGELRPVNSHHAAFSLLALTGHYFAAAPIVRIVSDRDPYEKANLKRRRREVLDFIRYGLFREPEKPRL